MNISLFGWLDRIPFWRNLSYPTKGALLRALKAGLSVTVGILLAAATQGILFPAELSPMVVLAITTVLQGVDKFLREAANEKEILADLSLVTDSVPEENPLDSIPTSELDSSPPSVD